MKQHWAAWQVYHQRNTSLQACSMRLSSKRASHVLPHWKVRANASAAPVTQSCAQQSLECLHMWPLLARMMRAHCHSVVHCHTGFAHAWLMHASLIG